MTVKKKAIKKAVKKAVKKSTEPKRMPLSKFVCGMLVKGISDEKIVEAMENDYPERDCTQKTVSWYRFAINNGRMEKVGFDKPKELLQGSRKKTVKKTATKKPIKKAVKKATKKAGKKVSRRSPYTN